VAASPDIGPSLTPGGGRFSRPDAGRKDHTMRIVIFKSEPNPRLRAFSDDPGGKDLPSQFAPWHAIGAVAPESELPHKFDRAVVEEAINSAGYQLWRLKSENKKAAGSSPT
jgi:hypothetical protein